MIVKCNVEIAYQFPKDRHENHVEKAQRCSASQVGDSALEGSRGWNLRNAGEKEAEMRCY
jgi:hypothetical protein